MPGPELPSSELKSPGAGAQPFVYLRNLSKTTTQRVRDYLTTYGLCRSPTRYARLFDRLPRPCNIVVAGLEGAGKTTLFQQFLSRSTPAGSDILKFAPLIALNLEAISYSDVHFISVDIGGCRPKIYEDTERQLCRSADAIIYMVDLADADRLVEARHEFKYIVLHELEGVRQGVPLLVMGTKNDRETAQDPGEIVELSRLTAYLAEHHPWHFVSTSLKTGQGVYEGLQWLSSRIKDSSNAETGASKSSEKTVSSSDEAKATHS